MDEEWLLCRLRSRYNVHMWVHHARVFTPHEYSSNAELGGKWGGHTVNTVATHPLVSQVLSSWRAAHTCEIVICREIQRLISSHGRADV